MRVALVTSDRKPNVGGGYTFEQEIRQSLIDMAGHSQHEYYIVTNEQYELPDGIKNIGYIEYDPRSQKGLFNRLFGKGKNIRNMDNTFREKQIDLLWYVGATTDLETDLPYICTVWDIQHRRQPFFPEVSKNGLWEKREEVYSKSLQRAAMIIAGNETSKKEIELFYQIPSERIHILPQMTPDYVLQKKVTNINLNEKYNIPEDYLFYPAQFWPHKNHINLLSALKVLGEKHGINLPLVLVGSDQGNLAYVKDHIRYLGLDEQVYILGYVPQEDLISLYCNAFALIYVSLFGPENLPPLEAFALGCPVIAMNVPGMKEQLGDRALFAEPGDVESIARQIKKLYSDSTLYQSLKNRGIKQSNKWTSHDFVQGVFNILDEFEYYRRTWRD